MNWDDGQTGGTAADSPRDTPIGKDEFPHPEPDPTELTLPGHYSIMEPIGRGGMSVVYLADDLKHGRQVAVKVLRSEYAESVGADRFLREIRLEASFQHPNIVPLYDSGEADGLPYYVMPFIEHASLRDRMEKETQLSLAEALKITREVAAGLAYAHERGVVHRDVKPENVLLTPAGAMVADFGIARVPAETGGESATTIGMALGTLQYMSPEQLGGERVDVRTDVWALGIVFYEMLAGQPPFTGRNRTAIAARIMSEPTPSLRVVRPDVPVGLESVVNQALAKVPAERFESITELRAALDAGSRPHREPLGIVQRIALAAGVVALAAALGVWRVTHPPAALDSSRIAVFPLAESGEKEVVGDVGSFVALGIGSALEDAAPLRVADAWVVLSEQQRANVASVTTADKFTIARDMRAGYMIDGSIDTQDDSTRVILWLYDVATKALVQRRTVSGTATDAGEVLGLALQGVTAVLPALLQPGGDVHRVPLDGHDLGALALWMQGKREYRSSRFEPALAFFERAIERDSTLAMAALDAAQAASWLGRLAKGEEMVAEALRHDAFLPPPQSHFAHGLHAYLTGDSDAAVSALRRALKSDPAWAEAHMALGEALYHLLPSREYPLDSLAEIEFVAATADGRFSPPIFHLAEMAIRGGDVDRGRELLDQYRGFAPASPLLRELTFMLACVERGANSMDWSQAVRQAPLDALHAAKLLAVAGQWFDCAEGGFKAVMRDSTVTGLHWGAVLGLQGILLARGRYADYTSLVDSVIGYRPPTWTLYLLGGIADTLVTGKGLEAQVFIRRAFGEDYEHAPSANLRWSMGVWHASRRDTELVRSLRDDLIALGDDRQANLFAASLSAQLAMLTGQSDVAISRLDALASTAPRDSVEWVPSESLGVERLLLARLLFDAARYDEALQVASTFDHASPIAYTAFLAASLSIRYRAARAMGRGRLVERYRTRLQRIGRSDLID